MLALIIGIIVGILIGYAEENFRFSILYHNAKNGDEESEKIMDQFDSFGAMIEQMFSK